jgi:hypothetical protein
VKKMTIVIILSVVGLVSRACGVALLVLVRLAIAHEAAAKSLHERPPTLAAAFTPRLLGWHGSMPRGVAPPNRLSQHAANELANAGRRERQAVIRSSLDDTDGPVARQIDDLSQPFRGNEVSIVR